jgi:hypothetical protein
MVEADTAPNARPTRRRRAASRAASIAAPTAADLGVSQSRERAPLLLLAGARAAHRSRGGVSGRPRRSSTRVTAARRPATPPWACTWTTTPCGSTPDRERIIVGNDGGLGISLDGGGSWEFPNTFAIGQFYNISVDMPCRTACAVACRTTARGAAPRAAARGRSPTPCGTTWAAATASSRSRTGPTRTSSTPLRRAATWAATTTRGSAPPCASPTGATATAQWEDSIAIVRGSTNHAPRDSSMRIAAAARARSRPTRTPWTTAALELEHAVHHLEAQPAGAVLRRQPRAQERQARRRDVRHLARPLVRRPVKLDRGHAHHRRHHARRDGRRDLRHDRVAQRVADPSGRALCRHRRRARLADRNDGGAWTELTKNFPGVPAGCVRVAHRAVEPRLGTFYVTFDNHRRGDFTPYVYMTTDNGRTFRASPATCPRGTPTSCT